MHCIRGSDCVTYVIRKIISAYAGVHLTCIQDYWIYVGTFTYCIHVHSHNDVIRIGQHSAHYITELIAVETQV